MRAPLVAFAFFLALPCFADTSPSTDSLATPPANAQRFSIVSTAGKHGSSTRWVTADGTHMGRESLLLRGMVTEVDSSTTLGADGMIQRVVIRGHTPNGDAGETFAVQSGSASWKSPVDAGSAPYSAPAEYVAFGGPFDLNADLVEKLLAAPDKTLTLLPGGKAHAEKLTVASVGDGAKKQQVTAYAVTCCLLAPSPTVATVSFSACALPPGSSVSVLSGAVSSFSTRSALRSKGPPKATYSAGAA